MLCFSVVWCYVRDETVTETFAFRPRHAGMKVPATPKRWFYYLLDMSALQVRSSRVDRCDRRFHVPGVSPVYDDLL